MKRIILGIVFLVAAVWGWHTLEESLASVKAEIKVETSEASETTSPVAQIISVLTAANSCADISVQTNSTFSSNMARRYRPAGFVFDKMQEYLVEGQACIFYNSFQIISRISQVYAAHLKCEGYYIYALRKIIV